MASYSGRRILDTPREDLQAVITTLMAALSSDMASSLFIMPVHLHLTTPPIYAFYLSLNSSPPAFSSPTLPLLPHPLHLLLIDLRSRLARLTFDGFLALHTDHRTVPAALVGFCDLCLCVGPVAGGGVDFVSVRSVRWEYMSGNRKGRKSFGKGKMKRHGRRGDILV